MTRDEFLNSITNWDELVNWCNEQRDCYVCDDVYSEHSYDEYITDQLSSWVRELTSWEELRNRLEELPIAYDYYRVDDCGDWYGLEGDDFDDYLGNALAWGDQNSVWDDDEEEYVEDIDEADDEPVESEDISVDELFSACNSTIQTIAHAKKAAEAKAEAEFNEFVVGIVAVAEGRT